MFSVEVVDNEGDTIASFGDAYHDKGWEKADSFMEGFRYAINDWLSGAIDFVVVDEDESVGDAPEEYCE